MRRHHYLYARGRYLTDPPSSPRSQPCTARSRQIRPANSGCSTPTVPAPGPIPTSRACCTPTAKSSPHSSRPSPATPTSTRTTGELRPAKFEPDAALHFQGDGETAWGTKFVIVAARNDDVHGRIILDVAWVPKHGGEAKTAMECFTRLAPLVPGAQGVIYDTALRGVHHQTLLRDLGLLPVNRVTAAKAGVKQPRRKDGRREEKSTRLETKTITLANGSTRNRRALRPRRRRRDRRAHRKRRPPLHRAHPRPNAPQPGQVREVPLVQRLPAPREPRSRHRHRPTPRHRRRRRTEAEPTRERPTHLPTDPDFARLYPRRNDAESINRNLDDTLWLRRAHSIGHDRQHLNLLGYALMVNGLALHRHRRRRPTTLAA